MDNRDPGEHLLRISQIFPLVFVYLIQIVSKWFVTDTLKCFAETSCFRIQIGKSRLNQGHDANLIHRFIVLLLCDKHRTVMMQFNAWKKTKCKWSLLIHKMVWKLKFIESMIIYTMQWVDGAVPCTFLICNTPDFIGTDQFDEVFYTTQLLYSFRGRVQKCVYLKGEGKTVRSRWYSNWRSPPPPPTTTGQRLQ